MLELFAVVFVVVIVFGFKSVRIVPQQSAWVIERLGRFDRALEPGLSIIIPFIERVAYRHDLKEVPYDVPAQLCITRDNVQVTIDGVLYFRVTDPARASYGSSNYEIAITQLAQTTLRSEVGKRELDKLLEERQAINVEVIAALDDASVNWGVKVMRYEIKDIAPPSNVLHAMQQQLVAEREKRALIAKSEGQRQEEINLADGAKAAAIAVSEGERVAAINRATGEAEAVRLVASATAEAIGKVATAISASGGYEAASLKVAEQYVDAFGKLAKESNTLIVPASANDIAGMVSQAMAVVGAMRSKATT